MKQRRIFSAFILAAALTVPASLLAQNEEKEKVKEKEKKNVEEIVIIRKGDKDQKVVVEFNGDKIIVNGTPIEDLKDGDITVRRNRIRDAWAYAEGLRGAQGNWNNAINANGAYRMFSLDSNRAMLGVTSEKTDKGVRVESITKGSAAEKAGLKKEDIITRVGDKKIVTTDDLTEAIKKQKPGDKIDVSYLREGKEQKVTAELGKWKGSNVFSTIPGQGFKMDEYNFNFGDLMPTTPTSPRVRVPHQTISSGTPKLGLSVQDTDDGKGVKVLEVDDESNAAKAGLKENDVITGIDGKVVNSADEVAKIIRESKDKISVNMKVQRNGKSQTMDVKIPRKLKTTNL